MMLRGCCRFVGILSWVAACVAVSAAADAAPAPAPNQRLARALEVMEQRGELSASDAQRLGRRALDHGEGPRIDALSKPGTRTCNNAAREAIRRWLRSNGADGPPAPPPPSSIGHLESSSLPLRVYYQTEADQPLAQQVLIAAGKREAGSHALYTALAGVAVDAEIANLFDYLAAQELEHKQRVERLYEDLFYREN
ncbi:MAG TPA: ferritin family protein [Polyangiaceae bacterium]|nr:ferritin family protein [Polyangiaceae bacterium]